MPEVDENGNVQADVSSYGYVYGVTGGNAYLDDSSKTAMDHLLPNLGSLIESFDGIGGLNVEQLQGYVDGIHGVIVNKTDSSMEVNPESGANTSLILNGTETDQGMKTRFYGAIGGDLVINGNMALASSNYETAKEQIDAIKKQMANLTPGSLDYQFAEAALKMYQIQVTEPNDANTPLSTVTRHGNSVVDIKSGSVIGGTGASAAVSFGNVNVSIPSGYLTISTGSDADEKGSVAVLDGSVATAIEKNANVIGWMNGGLAVGAGNDATSVVTGDSYISITGGIKDEPYGKDAQDGEHGPDPDLLKPVTNILDAMKGSGMNAIGVTGGGAAVSTLGGTATSEVGNTQIDVKDSTVIGLVGGGAAASVDATGVAEALIDSSAQMGNNNGTSDFGIGRDGIDRGPDADQSLIYVQITDGVNEGGMATATTGATNINLTGTTTAIGVVGGGVAVASHTYQEKNADGTSSSNSLGTSTAIANTGKSTIVVDTDGSDVSEGGWEAISQAVSNVINIGKNISIPGTGADEENSLTGLDNKGAALGIFGGGVAIGHGSALAALDGNGATAQADTAGSDIWLNGGYAAAVFGGGAAVTDNLARAEANMSGDVNIYTDSDMTTVGLFGGGLALSMEGTSSDVGANETLANSDVGTVTITNYGNTDGIFGGGMAIGNSNRNVSSEDETLQSDAVSSVQTSNITVEAGTVDAMQIEAFMDATKNNNDDGYPWWNRLGYNASAAMADLKGITDKTSIAAGGLGMGMTGKAEVTTANVTIAGEDTVIAKDILGGGIAIDNLKEGSGAHVGTSTINLKSGATVEGSVYAGGAVNGTTLGELNGNEDFMVEGHTGYDTTNTSSKVDTAIVNLNGTTIAGEISGQGYELTTNYGKDNNYNPYHDGNSLSYDKKFYESVKDSTLNFIGENTLSALGEGDYTGDGSKIHDFDNINFKSGSSTKLDGETVKVNSTALIDADGGTVKVEDGAYLDISELKSGFESGGTGTANTYKVVTEADKDSSIFWDDSDFLYDRVHSGVFAVVDETAGDGNFNVTYEKIDETNIDAAAQSMAESFNWYEGTGMFYGMIGNRGEGTNTGADEFFKDAQMAANKVPYQKGLMIGEDAAVTGNTVAIARDMADNVMQRLSFTDDYVQDAGWVNNDGGIWAKYIHRKYETENMGSSFGGIHSSTDYDGAIVGVDFAKHGNFQSGVAFHYGSGDGNGLISRNDYDAWGFTLYGSLKDEEAGTNLMADIGYVTSDNDIDGTVNGKSLSADRAVDAWTIGLRGEKEYAFGQNQLVPYVGLRYMSVNPGRYTSYYGGQKAFDYDADNQNLWLLPIGVSFRNETVTDSGWRITPKLDLSYIWAFGDTDTDMTVNAGADYTGNLYYDVMDDNSWLASLGVEATKDVWSFGVGYGYQKGDDTKNKTWFVNASYAF